MFRNRINKRRHVYLMKNDRNGFYKIGVSISPKFREKTLQSEEPEVRLIMSVEEDPSETQVSLISALDGEDFLHKTFADKRVRGEWFRLDEEDIDCIRGWFSSWEADRQEAEELAEKGENK